MAAREEVSTVFTIADWKEEPYLESDGIKLTKARYEKEYRGDIEGKSVTESLMVYRPDGTASYVGHERFEGNVRGKKGSFIIQSEGEYRNDIAEGPGVIVKGAGTGELEGPRGRSALQGRPRERAPAGVSAEFRVTRPVGLPHCWSGSQFAVREVIPRVGKSFLRQGRLSRRGEVIPTAGETLTAWGSHSHGRGDSHGVGKSFRRQERLSQRGEVIPTAGETLTAWGSHSYGRGDSHGVGKSFRRQGRLAQRREVIPASRETFSAALARRRSRRTGGPRTPRARRLRGSRALQSGDGDRRRDDDRSAQTRVFADDSATGLKPGRVLRRERKLSPIPSAERAGAPSPAKRGRAPENPGESSRSSGKSSRNWGSHPENLGSHPQNLGSHPENWGSHPENWRSHPQNLGSHPEN